VKRRAVLGVGRAFVAVLLVTSKAAFAQSIAVSGSPPLMRISTAVAGSAPTPITDNSTTYTVVTPAAHVALNFKITAQLDAAMPAGTTLTATFAAPTKGGTSSGAVALDVTARNVVTAIPKKANESVGITYQFSATVAAGVVPFSSRTVTITILAGP
jgi:hypothetical protein